MTTTIHCDRCGEVQFSDVFVGLVLSDKEVESVEHGLLLLHNSMMHKTQNDELTGKKS